jgi:hypothetical protein
MHWRAMMLGLGLVLGACAKPTGVSPSGPAMPGAAGYHVQVEFPRLPSTIFTRYIGIQSYDIDWSLEDRLKEWRGTTRPWLTRDPKLDAAARAHSWMMAVEQKGFTVSPDGKTLQDRMKDQGVTYTWWAGYAWGAQPIDDYYTVNVAILKNFDRSWVTNDQVRRYGIGVYRRFGKVYTTLLFTD